LPHDRAGERSARSGPPADLSVPLAGAGRQHFEELARQFALIVAVPGDGQPHASVPQPLMNMVQALTRQFGDAPDEAQVRLGAAIDRGDESSPATC
jgi:hypothetical protein